MTPLLARRGDPDRAFERLYRTHAPDIYRYSLAVVGRQSDAEDVTQTAFMNAYRAWSRGERPKHPRAWLVAIAHNVCLERFRTAKRRPSEVEYLDEAGGTVTPDDVPGAEDIRRALAELTFNQRSALVMRELEGRSYAEIAGVLSLSVSAVETLLFRARRALREQLETGLTCREAELALSKQVDGSITREERSTLRGHLRACPECATYARSLRAQRSAWKAIAGIPLPASLAHFGGTAVPLVAKAVVVALGVSAGVGTFSALRESKPAVAVAAAAKVTPAPDSKLLMPPSPSVRQLAALPVAKHAVKHKPAKTHAKKNKKTKKPAVHHTSAPPPAPVSAPAPPAPSYTPQPQPVQHVVVAKSPPAAKPKPAPKHRAAPLVKPVPKQTPAPAPQPAPPPPPPQDTTAPPTTPAPADPVKTIPGRDSAGDGKDGSQGPGHQGDQGRGGDHGHGH